MSDGFFFDRRDVLKLAAAISTTPGLLRSEASAGQQQPVLADIPPNDLPPAIHFQAAPGGTGQFLSSTRGANTNSEILPEPWDGDVPATDEKIAFLPVHRLATLLRDRKLSPVALTEIYLERLNRLDDQLLCVVNMMEESARAAAKQAEQEIAEGNYRGPLHGIPWGVKDLFSTRGTITTWGAKPYEHRVIDEDAEIVVRLRQAGAILLAKLATGTFAQGDQWYRGMTRNPWNLEEGSSGSSAGPGSATAAGCVAFSIGTETRGSIVSPARRCGISALRPTYGRVSRHGCMTLSWSMDKVGPMCRSIEDCALVFNVIHGADGKDPASVTAPFHYRRGTSLKQLRVGYAPQIDPAFLDVLKQMGAELVEVRQRPGFRRVGEILGVESAAAFDDFISNNLDEQMVRKVRVAGFRRLRPVTALDYLNAQRRRSELMREMDEFMQEYDLYVGLTGDLGLTNLTGHPAVVLPYTFADERPHCLTLVGKLFSDDQLLSVAQAYQSRTKWHLETPTL